MQNICKNRRNRSYVIAELNFFLSIISYCSYNKQQQPTSQFHITDIEKASDTTKIIYKMKTCLGVIYYRQPSPLNPSLYPTRLFCRWPTCPICFYFSFDSLTRINFLPFLSFLRAYPGKSFWLEFISNQCDLFQYLYPSQSKLIRMYSKKVINLVWCKSIENLSELIEDWIRINLEQFFNPNESEVGIWIPNSVWIILTLNFG